MYPPSTPLDYSSRECTLKIEGVGIDDVMKGEKTGLTFPTFTTTYIQERDGHHHLSNKKVFQELMNFGFLLSTN